MIAVTVGQQHVIELTRIIANLPVIQPIAVIGNGISAVNGIIGFLSVFIRIGNKQVYIGKGIAAGVEPVS